MSTTPPTTVLPDPQNHGLPTAEAIPNPTLRPSTTPISESLGLLDLNLPPNLPANASIKIGQTVLPILPGQPTFRLTIQAATPVSILSDDGSPIASFNLTPDLAHPPAVDQTPDWAKGIVWYQVFPERFRDGNPANNPRSSTDIFAKDWNSSWMDVPIDELEAARHAALSRSPAITLPSSSSPLGQIGSVVFRRRYGGDLQGVLQSLDHFRDLGVQGLYFTPLFRAKSLHKYETADFRHIDEHFGSTKPMHPGQWHEPAESLDPSTWVWTKADAFVRDEFLPALKASNFRVLFDGVWNHTGREHFAFADLKSQGIRSPFASWYAASFAPPNKDRGLPNDPLREQLRFFDEGSLIGWKAWDTRNGQLPAFAQTPEKDLAAPVKQHIFDITKRWMHLQNAPGTLRGIESGIDGWRLDVAAEIGPPFWKDWYAHVKKLNSQALTIAEHWYPMPEWFTAHAAADETNPDPRRCFDGQMNYPYARAVMNFLKLRNSTDSTRAITELNRAFSNHPATDLVQMNILTSHDTDRLASHLFNGEPDYDSSGKPRENSTYDYSKPNAKAYNRAKLAAAIHATYLGAPMIYYGEEFGMFGGGDPHNRKPMPWPDRGPYANPDDQADLQTLAWWQAWFSLRSHPILGPTLRLGNLTHIASGNPDVLAYTRQLDKQTALVIINRSEQALQLAQLPALDAIIPPTATPWPMQIQNVQRATLAPESATLYVFTY